MKFEESLVQLSLFGSAENSLPVLRTAKLEPSTIKRRSSLRRNKPSSNSSPYLKRRWILIRKSWFPDRPELDSYTVRWSKRPQLRTLASCSLDNRRVIVARELRYKKYLNWLDALLYHEMCHAYLNTTDHGREFKNIEKRHPLIKAFDNWIDTGGWNTAVRSDRAKRAHKNREK